MAMRRRRNNIQSDDSAEAMAKNSQSGPKITHLSDKSVSKQTKKVKEMNKKALAYIYSVK
ncbi:hypothetical protein FHY44_04000 [Bacillus sp. D12]|uniref:hypothetical protein n=2 Tax=Bacillales TaxID=1385 RepID=UPI0011211AD0|nr:MULTISPECIES: hypothetical protein [unclassified Bacillus (in: firmicutes)]TPF72915.1 hypothetical protein FHY44_04000 [Bacillus sp. D12]